MKLQLLFIPKKSFVNFIVSSSNEPVIILQFRKWFDDAIAANLREPNAMSLSTATSDGKPWAQFLFVSTVI